MIYEFHSTSFRTLSDMCEAIAYAIIGDNEDYLSTMSDEELADDGINGWDLTGKWAEERNFTREALIDAFAEIRMKGSSNV